MIKKSKKLIELFEVEDFDLSDNPIPSFKFRIGEEVMTEEDYTHSYDYFKRDRAANQADIAEDIATIVAREKNLKYVHSKHNDINSKYNIDLIYDTDFEVADYDFDVNEFINQPWYLLEYPREEDFGEVRMEWVPQEDVRELDFLNETEDFDLSDNPLVGVGKEYDILIKDFIKNVISRVKDKEIYPKGLKRSEIPDEVYEELRFVQDNHEGEIPGLDTLMANFSEGDILARIKRLLKQSNLKEEEDFDLSDNPLPILVKFKIGEKVMEVHDYIHYRNRSKEGYEIDTATIIGVEKNLKNLLTKHKDVRSRYDLNLIRDDDFYKVINEPWYLLEYPRQQDFDSIKRLWVPQEDVRELNWLREEEDFDLSDNPLYDPSKLINVLKKDFIIDFQMQIGITEGQKTIGWESSFGIKIPNGIEHFIVMSFNFADNTSPRDFKPYNVWVETEGVTHGLSKTEISLLLNDPKIINLLQKHRSRAKSDAKIKLAKASLRNLKEEISRDEAVTDLGAIQTIVDGKRGVGFITRGGNSSQNWETIQNMIRDNGLKSMHVKGNEFDAYVVYAQGYANNATELKNIAEKYGGYLHADATAADTRRIGELLEYRKDEIDAYIKKWYPRNIDEESDFDLSDNPLPTYKHLTFSKVESLGRLEYKNWELQVIDPNTVVWSNWDVDKSTRGFANKKVLYLRALLEAKEDDRWSTGEGTGVIWHSWISDRGNNPSLLDAFTPASEVATKEQFLEYSKKFIDQLDSRYEAGEFDKYLYGYSMDLVGLSEEDDDFDLSDNPIPYKVKVEKFLALNGQELNGWTIDTKIEESTDDERYEIEYPANLRVRFTKKLRTTFKNIIYMGFRR